MFDKLAEELKKARKEHNLNLQQLSAKTKIDIKFLEAIEAGDFAFLPELYVKAFIKEFARVVGLDEQKIVKKYENIKEGKLYEEAEEQADLKEQAPVKETRSEKKHIPKQPQQISPPVQHYDATIPPSIPDNSAFRMKQKKLIMIGSVAAVIIFLLVYLLFFNSDSDVIITEKPIEEVIENRKQRFVEEETPAEQSAVTQSADSLNLTIFSGDTSWVRIIFDNKRADEFILFPNSQKNLKTGNNFKITFGRSSAVKLQLNNQPLDFTRRGSEVSYVFIDSSGLRYLNSPPQID